MNYEYIVIDGERVAGEDKFYWKMQLPEGFIVLQSERLGDKIRLAGLAPAKEGDKD